MPGCAPHSSACPQTARSPRPKAVSRTTFASSTRHCPTRTSIRSASGAPGPQYWQQRADYDIDVTLDEAERKIIGRETIRYTNNSPETLRYVWIQLDQNRFRSDSNDQLTRTIGTDARISYRRMRAQQFMSTFDGGHKITEVSSDGGALDYVINGTQMRINLPGPLDPGSSFEFTIAWNYLIPDARSLSPRAGYEHFPEDGNDIFLIAQWYPRLVAFSDYEGWHNKEFLGNGEFTLEFGDFDVAITVPADHIVSSTGVLQNAGQVLTRTQRNRLSEARDADRPVFVVTPEEALENEPRAPMRPKLGAFPPRTSVTLRGRARASSSGMHRVTISRTATAHRRRSWPCPSIRRRRTGRSRYSTQAVIHTMEVYSRYSFAYPYPTAQSVNGPVGGMNTR